MLLPVFRDGVEARGWSMSMSIQPGESKQGTLDETYKHGGCEVLGEVSGRGGWSMIVIVGVKSSQSWTRFSSCFSRNGGA